MTFAGPGNPDIYHVNSHLVSPRVGVSWSPDGKTTVRGGFAMFSVPQNITTSVMNQTGYSVISSVVSDPE